MVFSSVVFIFFFLPITLAGYYLINPKYRNYWLLFVSLVFFGWSQSNYLWIILLNIAINYSAAMLIDDCEKLKKPVLVAAIIANFAILFYFKYFNFVIQTINKIKPQPLELKNIILPIGISFFTFQGMSYTIDVYMKRTEVQNNPLKVALYVTLFPQLIAGPIVRYTDIASEINNRHFSLDDFSSGIERFIIGLGKKAIIANTMGACVDGIWNAGIEHNTAIISWVGSIAYTLQIYFDFSGYSDMAIGLGRMFGFHFNENFNLPYISKSISEFWRRWHISLGTWFRDYVYIPLGGNRERVYLNLAIVFLLTGLWHGASWHFVAWGGYYAIFILSERWMSIRRHKHEEPAEVEPQEKIEANIKTRKAIKGIIRTLYTLFVVNIGWVIFRAEHTMDAMKYIGTMFGIIRPGRVDYTVFWYLDRWTITVMLVGILFASSLPTKMTALINNQVSIKHTATKTITVLKCVVLIALLYFSMLRIVSGTYNPFIYFQF